MLFGTWSQAHAYDPSDYMETRFKYILTAAQLLGSLDFYNKSRMTILGIAGVLFCENEQ